MPGVPASGGRNTTSRWNGPLPFRQTVRKAANGFLHPLLALNAGGYFPGLTTSLLMAAVGVLLLVQLARVTA